MPRNVTKQMSATSNAITGSAAPITPAIASTSDTTPTAPATPPVTTNLYARCSRTRRGV